MLPELLDQNDSIIKKNINGITQLFYIDEQGNRSKPLMILGNSNDNTFKWKHNILDCNLDDYEIYYKKILLIVLLISSINL